MDGEDEVVHLRVGCLDYGRGQAVQRAAISGLRARHPATRVTIVPESFDLQVADVVAGRLDVGFCAGSPPALPGVVVERLFEDRVDCALLSGDHALASAAELSVADLSRTELHSIDPDAAPEIMEGLLQRVRRSGWRGRATLDSSMPAQVITKIACGAGWTPAPRSLLGWDPPGTAVRPLADGALAEIDCHVLRRSDASEPAVELVRTLHRARSALERRTRDGEPSSAAHLARVRRGERLRIARELHDTVLQDVIAASLTLDAALRRWVLDGDGARAMVSATMERLQRTATAGRAVVTTLRSGAPSPRGLWLALSGAAGELRQLFPAELRLRRGGTERPLTAAVEEACYRIGVEALTNAFTHARARRVDVLLDYREDALLLQIADDGRGFSDAPRDPVSTHFGLAIMRERAGHVGATLALSSAEGRGTRVELRVPWRAPRRTPRGPRGADGTRSLG